MTGPYHTAQEELPLEEVVQKSTPASRPPPWELQHDLSCRPCPANSRATPKPQRKLSNISPWAPSCTRANFGSGICVAFLSLCQSTHIAQARDTHKRLPREGMVVRNSSAVTGAKAVNPQEEEAPALQQQRPRSAGRRLSSNSSTGSFTAISMEDEGLLGARHEEAALHTPQQQPPPLRSAASASHNSAPIADQGRRGSSGSAEAAWTKTSSSFSNPAFVADFTAIPPLTDSPSTHLPLPPTCKPAAGGAEHPDRATSRLSIPANAGAESKDEQQEPLGNTASSPTHMAATVDSLHDQGEEPPVDRCIVSGDSFYSGDLMSPNSGVCACVFVTARVCRNEVGGFGVRTAKRVLLVGLGAGYVSSFARLMTDIERGTSPRPGSLMGHCIMDSSTVVASMLSGVVAGPIVASTYLARLALRPALLAGAVHAGVRWVRRHRNGAAALLKMLSSGDLLRRIEALKGIAKRAANSPAFRREFGLSLLLINDPVATTATATIFMVTALIIATGRTVGVKQPRSVRACGAAAAAKANSTAAAAAAAVRGGRAGEGDMHGTAYIVGEDGNPVPVLSLSGPLPMLATQALKELLRSPEHTANFQAILKVQNTVLEAVASASVGEVNTSLPTAAAGAATAQTKGDKEEAAAKEGYAHAVATARMQLASDPLSVHLLVRVARGHMAMAVHERQLLLQAREDAKRLQLQADVEVSSKHFAAAWPAVRLLHAVALEPVGKAMLGEAQGVHALVEVLCAAPTGSKIMSAAAAALHTAVRGSVANSTLLSSLDLQPPTFQTQSSTLPVGGLFAAPASASSDSSYVGAGAAGHPDAKSTLRAHMHNALAHVNHVVSHSGAPTGAPEEESTAASTAAGITNMLWMQLRSTRKVGKKASTLDGNTREVCHEEEARNAEEVKNEREEGQEGWGVLMQVC
ncbi:hypothetical protein DUNSADRAFT_7799 [Dunaliella salina]|uniref:Uncharacterized protein n=1 Tax=Dunaliella salina TaxID=3046 RepID=A0ABQ7GKM7_DUNSA|nr:hypothetical protein DUNSADRAFT_7799 [Dunaliella salina]|eukprot:KAF5835170.1 hypothetical protein DUNSADRAFT_7799 [Dunaliella salina]